MQHQVARMSAELETLRALTRDNGAGYDEMLEAAEAQRVRLGAEMEAERTEYHDIAERRVRLGLLLSEIGQRNGINVSEQEMNQLVMQAAQQYRPEDRQKFVDYIRQEPMAAAQLRAPLFEDKVVDFLFSRAEIGHVSINCASA